MEFRDVLEPKLQLNFRRFLLRCVRKFTLKFYNGEEVANKGIMAHCEFKNG